MQSAILQHDFIIIPLQVQAFNCTSATLSCHMHIKKHRGMEIPKNCMELANPSLVSDKDQLVNYTTVCCGQ